jgi:hypothetical protein
LITAGTILGHHAGLVGGLGRLTEVLMVLTAVAAVLSGGHYFYSGVQRLRGLSDSGN